ncbi:MAG: hypothetical protein IKN49_02535 [Elusimicrobiaceae bacterium]|nr:hypothetical protein [Elusimicrobiaceae bacterium]
MRKIICALAVLAFLPVGADAKKNKINLDAVDQAAAQAQQEAAKTFDIFVGGSDFINLKKREPAYVDFLKEQVDAILAGADSISMEQIQKDGIVGIKWYDFSVEEESMIVELSQRANGAFEDVDLMVLLVLLDCKMKQFLNLQEHSFSRPHLDGHFEAAQDSDFACWEKPGINMLYKGLRGGTEAYRHKRTELIKYINSFRREVRRLRLVQPDGTINEQNIDKLMSLYEEKKKEAETLADGRLLDANDVNKKFQRTLAVKLRAQGIGLEFNDTATSVNYHEVVFNDETGEAGYFFGSNLVGFGPGMDFYKIRFYELDNPKSGYYWPKAK